MQNADLDGVLGLGRHRRQHRQRKPGCRRKPAAPEQPLGSRAYEFEHRVFLWLKYATRPALRALSRAAKNMPRPDRPLLRDSRNNYAPRKRSVHFDGGKSRTSNGGLTIFLSRVTHRGARQRPANATMTAYYAGKFQNRVFSKVRRVASARSG